MRLQGLELWLSADYDAMSLEYGVYKREDQSSESGVGSYS